MKTRKVSELTAAKRADWLYAAHERILTAYGQSAYPAPTVAQVAALLGVCERTVRIQLPVLRADGWLECITPDGVQLKRHTLTPAGKARLDAPSPRPRAWGVAPATATLTRATRAWPGGLPNSIFGLSIAMGVKS